MYYIFSYQLFDVFFYRKIGIDPEGSQLHYSISGPVFSVDRDTGVVRLRQELDREKHDTIEVIISITDESVLGTEPNTISLRREIPVRDFNDNPPVFIGRPYSTRVSEATKVGTFIDINPKIIVTDSDEGINSEMTVVCSPDRNSDNDDTCDVFQVITEKVYKKFHHILFIHVPNFKNQMLYFCRLIMENPRLPSY